MKLANSSAYKWGEKALVDGEREPLFRERKKTRRLARRRSLYFSVFSQTLAEGLQADHDDYEVPRGIVGHIVARCGPAGTTDRLIACSRSRNLRAAILKIRLYLLMGGRQLLGHN